MAGHSKWHNIQVRKNAQDKKKAKFFTKAAKEIIIAARAGGGDPDMNPRLRTAIAAAKAVNLPKDKIDNAIKKGTGELETETYEEITYEGYGPGGVALLIEAATDNKNRTVAEVRHILNKGGGSMGEAGSVGWMFDRKGLFTFAKDSVDEEKLMETALEAGAEDVADEGEAFEVTTAPEDFSAVQEAFEGAELAWESAEVTMIPQNLVPLEGENAVKLLKLLDAIEDNEDVQNVHANADIPDEVMESFEG